MSAEIMQPWADTLSGQFKSGSHGYRRSTSSSGGPLWDLKADPVGVDDLQGRGQGLKGDKGSLPPRGVCQKILLPPVAEGGKLMSLLPAKFPPALSAFFPFRYNGKPFFL